MGTSIATGSSAPSTRGWPRHGMLRTIFPGDLQQELPASLRLPVLFEDADDPAEKIAEERARVFEPWAWPLLRLRLITLGPDEHVLVVHAHHLIGDGYSAALLGRELLAAYDGRELPVPRSTFRDHVARLPAVGRARDAYRKPVADLGPARSAALHRRRRGAAPGRRRGRYDPVRRGAGRLSTRWPPSPGRTISCSASP